MDNKSGSRLVWVMQGANGKRKFLRSIQPLKNLQIVDDIYNATIFGDEETAFTWITHMLFSGDLVNLDGLALHSVTLVINDEPQLENIRVEGYSLVPRNKNDR